MTTPSAKPNASMLPKILFGYLAIFQIVLVGIAFNLYADQGDAGAGISVSTLFGDQKTQILDLVGVVTFAMGFYVPRAVLRMGQAAAGKTIKLPGAGIDHPLSLVISPYIIRLCLFETCTLIGFATAIFNHNWVTMLPLVVLGLLGTAVSVPKPAFFERFKDSAP